MLCVIEPLEKNSCAIDAEPVNNWKNLRAIELLLRNKCRDCEQVKESYVRSNSTVVEVTA